MTQMEKVSFLNDLIAGIQDKMINDIDRVPENWGGRELRQWLIDRVAIGAGKLDGVRLRRYRNEYRVRDL